MSFKKIRDVKKEKVEIPSKFLKCLDDDIQLVEARFLNRSAIPVSFILDEGFLA